MAQETSYGSMFVSMVLVAGALSSGLVLANTQGGQNSASIPAAAGIDAQPTTTANVTESQTREPGTDTTTPPDQVERHLGPVTVTILLNCSYFEVAVEPTTYQYTLVLDYRDTTSGQRIPMFAGPFTGSIDDPFGETDLQLVEVQIRVDGLPPITELAPERCTDP